MNTQHESRALGARSPSILALSLVCLAWAARVAAAAPPGLEQAGAQAGASARAGTLQAGSTALARYVSQPDPSFQWRELGSGHIGSVEYSEVILTSQTWRGIEWKHQLIVFRPERIDRELADQGFLFIHGGRWRDEYEAGWSGPIPRRVQLFARLAETMRAPLGVLLQVPHQPLWERTEDRLIAYTFDHYLRSGEEDWPLLLPMVKSAVRGMDAMQEVARTRWGLGIESFTVSGASKRGWTSWLTAAVDPRVKSMAPMVIDMLNIPAQIELQKATFGELSDEVQEYDNIDLPERVGSGLGRQLLAMVDPYSYRRSFTQPKLIVLGTNDRYWPVDALNVYWKDLPGPKHVLYVPNQGHGIRDVKRLMGSLSALHRHTARGESLPELTWSFAPEPGAVSLAVSSDRKPRAVRVWTASSGDRDFREARWRSYSCLRSGQEWTCRRPVAPDRYTAMYAEVDFRERGEPAYWLTTTMCLVGPEGSGEGSGC